MQKFHFECSNAHARRLGEFPWVLLNSLDGYFMCRSVFYYCCYVNYVAGFSGQQYEMQPIVMKMTSHHAIFLSQVHKINPNPLVIACCFRSMQKM